MTRFLSVLALTAAALVLSAGDAAAFGGRKKASCAPACDPCPAPACPMPCPAPVVHCAPPVVHCPPPAPVVHCAAPCPAPAPVCCPAPAPVCCDPCAKPARVGLLKRLFSRCGGGC